MGECWQLANQLARDDYTSIGSTGLPDTISGANAELPPIDEHSADWSCIAVALGPLFCLYSRMLRSSPHVTDSDLKERQNLSENSRIADQVWMLWESLIITKGEGKVEWTWVQMIELDIIGAILSYL